MPAIALLTLLAACAAIQDHDDDADRTRLPNAQFITPLAAPGSTFQALNPGLKDFPGYTVGQAMSEALSPDGKTLLILTSGYNRLNGSDGKQLEADSNEYVFVYDVSEAVPR
ncbi:MAG TPA: phosphoesterase, partial [Gammaproteobacteria bacterium]